MNLTKDWATIRNNWNYEYDEKHSTKKNKNIEKYEDTRNTMYKKQIVLRWNIFQGWLEKIQMNL